MVLVVHVRLNTPRFYWGFAVLGPALASCRGWLPAHAAKGRTPHAAPNPPTRAPGCIPLPPVGRRALSMPYRCPMGALRVP